MKSCPICKREVKDEVMFCPFDGQPLTGKAEIDIRIGTLLDDKYRLETKIGEGGMGTVYKATHVHMEIPVAVKILHSILASDQSAVERFRREARAAAQIRHPNAVSVTDFGVTKKEGIAYFVMEFLEGEDLRNKIKKKKQLDYEEAFLILNQTCLAVQAAHNIGIIHRDLKPDNIWLVKEKEGIEQVKVLDFGIAKLRGYSDNRLTLTGAIVGTPYYMSPEQCTDEELSPRSDVYSLGIILYEMLTGKVPFDGFSPTAIIVKHVTEPPMPIHDLRPGIPGQIEEVVLRALEKKPENRQESVLQLAQEFEAALGIGPALSYQTMVSTQAKLEPGALISTAEQSEATTDFVINPAPDSARPQPPTVLLDRQTVHLTPPDLLKDPKTVVLPATIRLRFSEVLHQSNEHIFEELILHKDYERLWRSLIHAEGGRNLLTGYGSFGGTSLVRCAVAKARTELQRTGQKDGALLVFYFQITRETNQAFEIQATNFGFSHLKKSDDLIQNPDLSELKERANKSAPAASSVLDFSLESPLEAAFFSSSGTTSLPEPVKQNYDFSQFVADLNAFFKQRKSNRALRQIIQRLVRSEFLPSRVVFIIDRVKHIETLEALFKSELFSNRRIRVIAVARKEDLDSWVHADARLAKIGFAKWYVRCLWQIDWDRSLFSNELGRVSGLESKYGQFLKHLMYIGRGSLGNIIDELKHPMNTIYGDSYNFVDVYNLVDRAEIQHNAWMQDVLDKNWPTILDDLFGGRDQDERTDRARIGVYYLIDLISHRLRFTESEIIKASKRFPIAISDDTEIAIKTIENLLYVLLQNRYLSLKDNQYRVIWNKDRPPKPRRVRTRRKKRAKVDRSGAPTEIQKQQTSSLLAPRPDMSSPDRPVTPQQTEPLKAAEPPPQSPVIIFPLTLAGNLKETGALFAPNAFLQPPARPPETPPETALLQSDPNTSSPSSLQETTSLMAQPSALQRSKVLVSYSHADKMWLQRLQVHLKPIEREDKIEFWDDTKIRVGARWEEEIKEAIAAAKVAVLLVSANFIASDFITDNELPPLLTASEKEGTMIISIIVSPCMFEQTRLSRFQPFNAPSNPLSSMKRYQQEELFVKVAETIKHALGRR
jgi:eukaryotic-like serine/threonine-protein kinase